MPKSIVFLLLLLPSFCMAQGNDASQKIVSKFNAYSGSHPGEKVYLHLDRPYYAAGDTLYYKAYVTLAGSHELSALSGVLHVELIDNLQGRVLLSQKLEVTNGVSWGDFALPDTLTNGSYTMRAYTNLMRNDGEGAFFTKDIPVVTVKPKKDAAATTKTATATATQNTTSGKPVITFFPEGGTLVTGIPSKIAFKAININGMGTGAKGLVTDNNGKQVCVFSATHSGMGAFFLTPAPGKTYKASVTYANGAQDMTDLPAAMEDGITLSAVNDSMLVIPVTIKASSGYFKANKGQTFILSVFTGGEMTNIPCRLDSTTLQAYLYKKKLYTGITRLTLFSPNAEPLCERILFINNNDGLKLGVNSEEPTYGKRQKVVVRLTAKDIKDQPIKGDFSVAVTDEGKAPADTNVESTIINYLLLSSELKGNIEQPNYYFNHATAEAQSNLDNLMLTQGYRRFDWKAVMSNTDTVPQYPAETELSLKGTVKNLQGKPMPYVDVALGAIKQMIAMDTLTDENGGFTFHNLYITDTAKLLIKAGKGNRSWKADITPDEIPPITKITAMDTTALTAIVKPEIAVAMKKQYMQYGNMKAGIMLKQVNIKEDKNPEHLAPLLHSDNLNGAGRANQVIMGADLGTCPTVWECLPARLMNVNWSNFTSVRTAIALNGNTKSISVMIGGIIYQGSEAIDQLKALDGDEVYSIEALFSPYYLTVYGSKATGGLLVITLRNGGERNAVNIQPGLTTYMFKGYYKARQYYSPVYDVKTPAGSTPDLRTTLFWKPVVITDKDGNASFEFYTSDNTGNYRIVVEGISADGNIGRAVNYCTVQ